MDTVLNVHCLSIWKAKNLLNSQSSKHMIKSLHGNGLKQYISQTVLISAECVFLTSIGFTLS